MKAIVIFLMLLIGSAEANDNSWLRSWIPASCCVTNDCCWEIQSSDVTSLPNDSWIINATGQQVARMGWSPDGKYYRCACVYNDQLKSYIKQDSARTRCLFVPRNIN